MNYLMAILAGAIQGLTEFLPVSSSAHLLFFHQFFSFDLVSNLAFDVALHWGTFLALLIYFFKDVKNLIISFFKSIRALDFISSQSRLPWLIIIGTIPAVIAGLLFDDLIENFFHQGETGLVLVCVALIIVSVIFILAEKLAKNNLRLAEMSWGTALLCGLAQACALIPGVSRSGGTISAGLLLGLNRVEAARFSFLLSMPIVFGAATKQLIKISFVGAIDWPLFVLGIFVSLIVGYIVIAGLLKYLERHSLNIFAYYRLSLAVLVLLWLWWR